MGNPKNRSNTKTILGRTTTKTYSNPDDEYGGTKYYSSSAAADDLVKTKLITKKSGQKVIKTKGEKRRKVDSFYEDSPLNRKDLVRNASALKKVKNPLNGGDEKIGASNMKKAEIIPPQNPGVYKSINLDKVSPKADFFGYGGEGYKNPELKKGKVGIETSPSTQTGVDQSELFWRSTAHKALKGNFGDLMHLERHGQTSRALSSIATPDEKIKKGFKKGWEETYAKPKKP